MLMLDRRMLLRGGSAAVGAAALAPTAPALVHAPQAGERAQPYAVSTEDRTINPDLERFMAKRMGAKTVEVKASHLSLISHPEESTRLIFEAAGQQA
jgi:hypothetical protein